MLEALCIAVCDYGIASPQEILSPEELFVVRSRGEDLYCSVRCFSSFPALLVCPGENGLAALRRELSKKERPTLSELLSFDALAACIAPRNQLRKEDAELVSGLGLTLSGSGAWPFMRKLEKNRFPDLLKQDEDVRKLLVCLRAALFLLQQLDCPSQLSLFAPGDSVALKSKAELGFSDIFGENPSAPLLIEQDRGFSLDIVSPAAQICAQTENNADRTDFKAELIRLPELVYSEPPFLPCTLLLLDIYGEAQLFPLCSSETELANRLSDLLNYIGKNAIVQAQNADTRAFLSGLPNADELELITAPSLQLTKLKIEIDEYFAPEDSSDSPLERLRGMKRSMRRNLAGCEQQYAKLISEYNKAFELFADTDKSKLKTIALLLGLPTAVSGARLAQSMKEYYLSPDTLSEILSQLRADAFDLLLHAIKMPVALADELSEDAVLGLCFYELAQLVDGEIRVMPALTRAVALTLGASLEKKRKRIMLIRRYVEACVNLYGAAEKGFLIETFNKREKEPLSREELERFLSPALFGMPGECFDSDGDWFFSNEYRAGSETYKYLLSKQGGRAYIIPDGRFSDYSDVSAFEPSDEGNRLSEYLSKLTGSRAKAVLGVAVGCIRRGFEADEVIYRLENEYAVSLDNEAEFTEIFDNAATKIGKWQLRGAVSEQN